MRFIWDPFGFIWGPFGDHFEVHFATRWSQGPRGRLDHRAFKSCVFYRSSWHNRAFRLDHMASLYKSTVFFQMGINITVSAARRYRPEEEMAAFLPLLEYIFIIYQRLRSRFLFESYLKKATIPILFLRASFFFLIISYTFYILSQK